MIGDVNLFTTRTPVTEQTMEAFGEPATWYDRMVRDQNMVIAGPSRCGARLLIAVGVVMLMQPFVLWLFPYSFIATPVGTVMFIIVVLYGRGRRVFMLLGPPRRCVGSRQIILFRRHWRPRCLKEDSMAQLITKKQDTVTEAIDGLEPCLCIKLQAQWQRRAQSNWQWHLDEVFVKINGET